MQNKDSIWLLLMTLTPMLMLMNFGNGILQHPPANILLSACMAIFGAFIGFILYNLTKGKQRIFKLLALVLIFIICYFIALRFLNKG